MKGITILLLLLPTIVKAQSRTTYYNYNSSNGTSERIGYSETTPIAPTYSPYVGFPVETYERVGRYKQQEYEQRIEIIQRLISDAGSLIIQLSKIDHYLSDKYYYKHNEYVEQLNKSKGVGDYNTYMYYKSAFTNLKNQLVSELQSH